MFDPRLKTLGNLLSFEPELIDLLFSHFDLEQILTRVITLEFVQCDDTICVDFRLFLDEESVDITIVPILNDVQWLFHFG